MGGYSRVGLLSVDETDVHLVHKQGCMDGDDTEVTWFDELSVCRVPLRRFMDDSMSIDERADAVRGWEQVEVQEGEELTSVNDDGLTKKRTITTTFHRTQGIYGSRETQPADAKQDERKATEAKAAD